MTPRFSAATATPLPGSQLSNPLSQEAKSVRPLSPTDSHHLGSRDAIINTRQGGAHLSSYFPFPPPFWVHLLPQFHRQEPPESTGIRGVDLDLLLCPRHWPPIPVGATQISP